MNRKIEFIFVGIFFCILIVSCSKLDLTQSGIQNKPALAEQGDIANRKTDKLNVSDIKKRYTGGEKGTIINITDYQHYVLVEYNTGNNGNCFDWYNLDTGDWDVLPIGPINAKLKEIKNPNDIVFITDGIYNINNYKRFPYIIECVREQENTDSQSDFICVDKARYFMVDHEVEFGNGNNEILQNISITPEYVQMSFSPAKGYEMEFYAGYTAIPPAKTSYINEKRQLVIEFEDTQLGSELLKHDLKFIQPNEYFESVELKQDEKNVKVFVNLKNSTKFYNARIDRKDLGTELETPFVRFYFAQNDDNDVIINSH
ncbi:MAG TPA: hypothetical protein DD429_03110 [Clostridiaceae bacterium]|nr:hypothetical protein [Clostridiaceae bacterium]